MSLKPQTKDSILYLKRILRWVFWPILFPLAWLVCLMVPFVDWLEYDNHNEDRWEQ